MKKLPFSSDFPLILSPMAGFTDRAFRRICREQGADMTVTEMISAKAVHYNDLKTASLAFIGSDEPPCALQIFGSEPDIMAESAYRLSSLSYHGCASEAPPSMIDINMGCPVRKVVSNGEGSALMKDPELIYKIVRAVSAAVDIPVSVKIRTGFDSAHINAAECAKAAESGGASMICVHGRTREQMYQPPVDKETIAAVKRAVDIPVIANGGINGAADALEMISATGCDGLGIARGALGNPFIFSEIRSALTHKEFTPPDAEALLECAKYHLSLLKEYKGEAGACLEGRSQLIHYVRGIKGASSFRDEINRAESSEKIAELIDKMTEKYRNEGQKNEQ